jgi:transposase-like protein
MIASLIRTIFSQPDAEYVHTQHAEVVRMLERIHPKTAELLAEAKEDLLAFTNFPRAHWRQIWSTNPLERLNREIKRRTDVVGVFPNPEALLRLTTMVLIEQHDEWAATNRRYLAEGSLKSLTHPAELDEEVTRQLNIA